MTTQQDTRLAKILPWATLAGELLASERPYEQSVHLRPSATSVRLVDLRPDRPQLDCGEITSFERAREQLHERLSNRPTEIPGRPTPEKKLQSFLIAAAYRSERRLAALSQQLSFVTDEQVFFRSDNKRVVCDLLAIRTHELGDAPVVIELKTKREMTRLIEQLDNAAQIIDAHREAFAHMFGAILSREVKLVGPCERWLIWPASSSSVDPRRDELARQRIVVKGYKAQREGFAIL